MAATTAAITAATTIIIIILTPSHIKIYVKRGRKRRGILIFIIIFILALILIFILITIETLIIFDVFLGYSSEFYKTDGILTIIL